jgi:hypothetical protein
LQYQGGAKRISIVTWAFGGNKRLSQAGGILIAMEK